MELEIIKTILRFMVSTAYHLRLEVAYYNDRRASLRDASAMSLTNPNLFEDIDEYISDDDGLERDEETSAAITAALHSNRKTSTDRPHSSSAETRDGITDGSLLNRSTRCLLSPLSTWILVCPLVSFVALERQVKIDAAISIKLVPLIIRVFYSILCDLIITICCEGNLKFLGLLTTVRKTSL